MKNNLPPEFSVHKVCQRAEPDTFDCLQICCSYLLLQFSLVTGIP